MPVQTTEISVEYRVPKILESQKGSGPRSAVTTRRVVCARGWGLTEEVQFLIGLQGFFSGEGEVEPARATQVKLHSSAEDLNV